MYPLCPLQLGRWPPLGQGYVGRLPALLQQCAHWAAPRLVGHAEDLLFPGSSVSRVIGCSAFIGYDLRILFSEHVYQLLTLLGALHSLLLHDGGAGIR